VAQNPSRPTGHRLWRWASGAAASTACASDRRHGSGTSAMSISCASQARLIGREDAVRLAGLRQYLPLLEHDVVLDQAAAAMPARPRALLHRSVARQGLRVRNRGLRIRPATSQLSGQRRNGIDCATSCNSDQRAGTRVAAQGLQVQRPTQRQDSWMNSTRRSWRGSLSRMACVIHKHAIQRCRSDASAARQCRVVVRRAGRAGTKPDPVEK